jgi:hypothetical protein
VSGGSRGRLAALPSSGYRPARRQSGADGLIVRYVPENPQEEPREFDLTSWKVSPALREAFAAAFSERTRPGGRVRTVQSADKTWRILRTFSNYLAGLVSPPTSPAELTRAHLDGWYLVRRDHVGVNLQLSELKQVLRKLNGLSVAFLDAINERNPTKNKTATKNSYSRAENQRIIRVARADVRSAATRIRAGRELLRRWRAGELEAEPEDVRRLGQLLDYVDTHSDVPRTPRQKVPVVWAQRLGNTADHLGRLHLSATDVAAFAVLLVGLTGQNTSTIFRAPAHHHRTDGYSGEIPTAMVRLDKPRRGARRHMDAPLTGVPTWAEEGMPAGGEAEADPNKLDLRSPFGVYQLLHELSVPGRRMLGTDRLFVWWGQSGGKGTGRGLRIRYDGLVQAWSAQKAIPADVPGEQLVVTLQRLRLTFNEFQQRPVAHTDKTLANEYLARNRGNLVEYQHVVAAALAEQVSKADTRARMRTLSAQDVAEAQEDLHAVAARHGMDAVTLGRMLTGELNTVMGACVDHTNSPHADAGEPCRASFMLCLSCPCARATPAHLPVQVLVYDELQKRKSAVTPLRWAQRFALAHNQLGDLLDRAGETAVVDARTAATPAQRQLAQRFLNRELDTI